MATVTALAAVDRLVKLIESGDLDQAREWAADHQDALHWLRSDVHARTRVATACAYHGAPMVWPWGDRPTLNSADKRVLTAIRAGNPWRGSEDTINRLIAYGEIRKDVDGRLVAA